jgi:branched-chain amino acid transport system permease protein
MRIKISTSIGLLVVLGIIFAVPAFVTKIYWLHTLTMFAIHGILALGLWLVLITGQVSFGQAAFMGIGGYASAVLCRELGLGLFATLIAGGLSSALLGLVFGLFTLRVRGAYFFMLSFAFAEIVKLLMRSVKKDFLGGPNGILGIPHPSISLAGWKFNFLSATGSNESLYYILTMAVLLVVFLVVRVLSSGRFGKELRGIAQADNLAESVGINVFGHLLKTFVIGCFIAGVAGAIQSYKFTMVTSDWMDVAHSVDQLSWVVVGGTGSIYGPLIGALVLTIIGEGLRSVGAFEPIFSGATLIIIMLFLPGGLVGILPAVILRFQKFAGLVGQMIFSPRVKNA